jgi:hypothetical protein
MWTFFIPLYKTAQRVSHVAGIIALLAPILPFSYWLAIKNRGNEAVEIDSNFLQLKETFRFPDLESNKLSTKYAPLEALIPDFSQELVFYGFNTRPDATQQELLLGLKHQKTGVVQRAGVPFYIGYKEKGSLDFCDRESGVYSLVYEKGNLQVGLIGREDTLVSFAIPLKKGVYDTGVLRLRKEELQRLKFLGKDSLKLFLNDLEEPKPIRFFDPVQKRMYLTTTEDLMYLKEGKLLFGSPKESFHDLPVCQIQKVEDSFIEMKVWDSTGFLTETVRLPLEKPEKYGPKIQGLLEGAKPFGFQAIWVKKPQKMALYVGDWLYEEKGFWTRPPKQILKQLMEGKYKAPLLYFSEMKKEGGKWVVQFEVFDGLHVQKETLRVTLDTKLAPLATTPSKSGPSSEKKGESKEALRHYPPAIDPMLDDFGDDFEDF